MMRTSRLLKALREVVPWIGFAYGDPLALEAIHQRREPSLAHQMTEILDAISEAEQKWKSPGSSPRGGWNLE